MSSSNQCNCKSSTALGFTTIYPLTSFLAGALVGIIVGGVLVKCMSPAPIHIHRNYCNHEIQL